MEKLITLIVNDVTHLKTGFLKVISPLWRMTQFPTWQLNLKAESRHWSMLIYNLNKKTREITCCSLTSHSKMGKTLMTPWSTTCKLLGHPSWMITTCSLRFRLPPRQANSHQSHHITTKFNKLNDRIWLLSHKSPAGVRYARALYMLAKMQQKQPNLFPIGNQLIRDSTGASSSRIWTL